MADIRRIRVTDYGGTEVWSVEIPEDYPDTTFSIDLGDRPCVNCHDHVYCGHKRSEHRRGVSGYEPCTICRCQGFEKGHVPTYPVV